MRVLIADDHPILLHGLQELLRSQNGFEVVAACPNGTAALRAIRDFIPEVAVLDISMPQLNGLDVLAAVAKEGLPTRIVFLTASATDDQIVKAVTRGAWGIMLKESAADDLVDCLRAVASGSRWLPSELVNAARNREAGRHAEANRVEQALTPREREIARLISEGLSNKEIGRRLNVSDGTIKIHLHNIYQKLGVSNRTALAALALTHRDRLR